MLANRDSDSSDSVVSPSRVELGVTVELVNSVPGQRLSPSRRIFVVFHLFPSYINYASIHYPGPVAGPSLLRQSSSCRSDIIESPDGVVLIASSGSFHLVAGPPPLIPTGRVVNYERNTGDRVPCAETDTWRKITRCLEINIGRAAGKRRWGPATSEHYKRQPKKSLRPI